MKTRRYQILSEDHWDEYGERIIVLDRLDGRKFYANRKDFDRDLCRETIVTSVPPVAPAAYTTAADTHAPHSPRQDDPKP